MEFNEVINKRKTSREWTDRDVDFEVVKRVIEAGMKAPSWDHYRNWQFIVLHTKEEKENAFGYAKYIADRFDLRKYENRKLNLAQKMYSYAMPRQYIMLAAINEGLGYSLRIPLNKEHNIVLEELGVPGGWMTPCFIGIGYPKEDELVLEQYSSKPDKNIHMGAW